MHVAATNSYLLNNVGFQTSQSVRPQARTTGSATQGNAAGETESLVSRMPDSDIDSKLADYSKIQSAFVAALKTGQSIEGMALFEPIQ